jgi:hypothetical protein
MAKKTKPVANVPDEDGQITLIDILKLEVDNKLPYWLAPQEVHAAKHDEVRRAKYAKYSAEQKAKRKR